MIEFVTLFLTDNAHFRENFFPVFIIACFLAFITAWTWWLFGTVKG